MLQQERDANQHSRAPSRVDYPCGHSELLLPGAEERPPVIAAAHPCPRCCQEELGNPFDGEFGYHLHAVTGPSAGMLPGWTAARDDALALADALSPTHPALVITTCSGPRRCPQMDHGDEWVSHIAHLAYLHEAHGSGWSTVCIDDYDEAARRQDALAPAGA